MGKRKKYFGIEQKKRVVARKKRSVASLKREKKGPSEGAKLHAKMTGTKV